MRKVVKYCIRPRPGIQQANRAMATMVASSPPERTAAAHNASQQGIDQEDKKEQQAKDGNREEVADQGSPLHDHVVEKGDPAEQYPEENADEDAAQGHDTDPI
jgi:hypothetical protein